MIFKRGSVTFVQKRFLSFSGEEFCGSFEVLIEKKIGKRSERLDLIMIIEIFVVMTLSIEVADFLATWVSLFIKAIAPH